MSKEADRKFIRNFIGVLAALAVAGIVFGVLGNMLAGVYTDPNARADRLAMLRAERLQPVGEVNTASEPSMVTATAATSEGSSAAGSGQQVVEQVCSACHANEAMHASLGAPQIGKTEQWQPRIEQGLDTLVTHVTEGFGKMPAQPVSPGEARAAIEYMVVEKTGIELK